MRDVVYAFTLYSFYLFLSFAVRFLDMEAALAVVRDEDDEDDDDGPQYLLPPHQRCAAHTLNLVATNEVQKAAAQGLSRKVFRSSMAKCAAIWNKAHRSTLAAEAVKEIADMMVLVPCVTRWSSEYKAVAKLTALTEDQLSQISEELSVPSLLSHEMTFLREYVDVLEPLAKAIDILQGEKNCYLGVLIPTITSLKTHLSNKVENATYTPHIINAVISSLDIRFGEMMSTHEAEMATTTHPKFKLTWLPEERRGAMLLTAIHEANELQTSTQTQSAGESSTLESAGLEEDNFFVCVTSANKRTGTAEEEMRRFLQETPNTVDSLLHFPLVKKLFIKYNVTLPSSAPVERLFSYGGTILTAARNRLSDAHMEQLLLLRYNWKFCPPICFDD